MNSREKRLLKRHVITSFSPLTDSVRYKSLKGIVTHLVDLGVKLRDVEMCMKKLRSDYPRFHYPNWERWFPEDRYEDVIDVTTGEYSVEALDSYDRMISILRGGGLLGEAIQQTVWTGCLTFFDRNTRSFVVSPTGPDYPELNLPTRPEFYLSESALHPLVAHLIPLEDLTIFKPYRIEEFMFAWVSFTLDKDGEAVNVKANCDMSAFIAHD